MLIACILASAAYKKQTQVVNEEHGYCQKPQQCSAIRATKHVNVGTFWTKRPEKDPHNQGQLPKINIMILFRFSITIF